jgi:hypothetical protein|tara:strand:- start:574 stop:762 length:189 start_codon:yes stop_codon:yes gene_type:complete
LRFYHLGFVETGRLELQQVAWLMEGMKAIAEAEAGGPGAGKAPDQMSAAEKIKMYKSQGRIS